MARGLAAFLRVSDGAMLLYWLVAASACVGLIRLPGTMMYAGYGTPVVDAWNWSFAPLDLAFCLAGLTSLRLARSGQALWRPLALVSLLLTMCAGGMAISYWAMLSSFSIAWWLPNLLLLVLPLIWLPGLVRDLAGIAPGGRSLP